MSSPKQARNHFHLALRTVRLAKGLSQEDFSLVSSRTYVSSLERAQKSATLGKVDDLADVLGVHPLTLLTLAYAEGGDSANVDGVFSRVRLELGSLCGSDAKAQAVFVAGLSQPDAV